MERSTITINKSGNVNIPSGNVWMSEMELVVLFGVITQVFQIVIRVIYKSETLTPMTTQQCTVITFTNWKIFYNHEIIIVLVFRRYTISSTSYIKMVIYYIFSLGRSDGNRLTYYTNIR